MPIELVLEKCAVDNGDGTATLTIDATSIITVPITPELLLEWPELEGAEYGTDTEGLVDDGTAGGGVSASEPVRRKPNK